MYFFQVTIDKILPADKYEIKAQSAGVSRLEIHKLTMKDQGVYWCEAAFDLEGSKWKFELKVLSIAGPLKPFVAVVAEVAILVTLIALYEVFSKRKGKGKFPWGIFGWLVWVLKLISSFLLKLQPTVEKCDPWGIVYEDVSFSHHF